MDPHAGGVVGETTPSSTTAVSRYINIATMRSNAPPSQRGPLLPTLQMRLPATTESTRRQRFEDLRESSLVLSESYKTDASMQKYLRELVEELEITNTVTVMPAPPVAPDHDGGAADIEIDDGPLSDPALKAFGVFRHRHLGLLVSVVFASLLTSCLKRGVLPLMRSELQMAPYQADAAEVLVMLPWASMFFLGFASDCVALFGSHRKAYVVTGWALVVVSLFSLAAVTFSNAKGSAPSAAFVNGAVFLLGVACFGGILTVVMAEVYFVAMSKRERLQERGEVVGTLLLVQFLCETAGQTLTNYVVFQTTRLGVQPLYTLQEITVFLSFMALIPLVASALFFQEDKELMRTGSLRETELVAPPSGVIEKVKNHARLLWATLQRESSWSVVRFLALFVFFSEFAVRYAHLVLDEVCGVTLPVASTGKIIAELLSFGAVLVWRMFLLNFDWKWLALLTFVGAAWLPQLLYFQLVLFNVSRDVGVYLLVSSTKAFVRGVIVALQVAMTVEIAPRGAEGATMGAIMSIATAMRLLATTASNALSFAFDTQTIAAKGLDVQLSLAEEIEVARDPTAIQLPASLERRVLLALLVCYSVKLLACAGVGFLPHQKHHLQWLHRAGKPQPRYALWSIGLLSASLLIAATFNALVVTPRTSCLKAFGGKGCFQ